MKKILDMTPDRAKKYFMKNTSYFSLELPKYFDFTELLKKIDKKIQGKNLSDFYKNANLEKTSENISSHVMHVI